MLVTPVNEFSLFRAISLRHSIYVHFCLLVLLGRFVDRWWLKEVWPGPDFLVRALYRCDPNSTRSRKI